MRLELDVSTAEKVYDANFNSIKVRLELATDNEQLHGSQFHKGAIRTNASSMLSKDELLFQFHKGAVRTLYCLLLDTS